MDSAQALRSQLRADLLDAMKTKRAQAVAALRTTIAAIDNAEAVEAPDRVTDGSEHVAGARAGVGSTEATRQALSLEDVRAIVQAEVSERLTEAERYDEHGHQDLAEQLRQQADVLAVYLGR